MKKILQKEAPNLREISKAIPVDKIASAKIQSIIRDMKSALASQDDGVAIAAPQIGQSLRIFVISGKVESILKGSDLAPEQSENSKNKEKFVADLVFINPVIKKISKEKIIIEEGCLSVRYLYGKVSRSSKATVEAYDENGKKFTRGGSGLIAQIFQHEIDHLDGVLFIDKAKYIEEILPESLTKKPKDHAK